MITIDLLIFWLLPYILTIFFQYIFGELYLISKVNKFKAGYIFILISDISVKIYSAYLIIRVPEAYWIGILIFISSIVYWFKFTKRIVNDR